MALESGSKLNFRFGTQAQFNSLGADKINLGDIYFVTDTQRLFVGETEYSRPVQSGATLPTGFAPVNSLFFHTTEKVLYVSNGSTWTKVDNSGILKMTTSGSGNVVTDVSYANGTFTITKGTAPTTSEVSAIKTTADAASTKATQNETKINGLTTRMGTAESNISDLTTKITGLTGAMHFVGVSTTDPKGNNGATVSGHTTWAAGDVVLYNTKEFVLKSATNNKDNWVELGDEGSFATQDQLSALESAYKAADKTISDDLTAHTGNTTVHITAAERTSWNAKATTKNVTDAVAAAKSELEQKIADAKTDSTYTFTAGTDGSFSVKGGDYATATKISIGKPATAGTADKATVLANARTIAISGAVTGAATSFNGSSNITISTTSVDGTKVTGKVPNATAADTATSAGSATKATQDASGNVITTTYATKTELSNAALKWKSFTD